MMRVGYFARLVCPDDATDMILYAQRADVPAHLHEDLYRLACWAEKLGDYVETECGHLYAGPALLEDEGKEVWPWDWVRVEGGWMAERAGKALTTMVMLAPWEALGLEQPLMMGRVSG